MTCPGHPGDPGGRPDAVIIVGTRGWSSLGVSDGADESEIVNNPVDATNIMYAFHFYAASHQDNYRTTVARAATRLPRFVTRCGPVLTAVGLEVPSSSDRRPGPARCAAHAGPVVARRRAPAAVREVDEARCGQDELVTTLPAIPPDRPGALAWVRAHLGHLTCDEPRASAVRGGQAAADAALATLDITGYAARRSTVLPEPARGATGLSPYIRHGLLPLPVVWDAVKQAPSRDRAKFRDELLWQEYARHVYARLGRDLRRPLRYGPPVPAVAWEGEPWRSEMACMDATTSELHEKGWVVNQARMWLSSQYGVRAGQDWLEGADEMYRHLLDGSPAANLLGWQWTVGTATGRPYGFSRWQVERRAPQLCRACPLSAACPIEDRPETRAGGPAPVSARLSGGVTDSGPTEPAVAGAPVAVWLTAESLGDADPALAAHPDLPRIFVFDEPLLARLRLSGKRLLFLAETLAELGAEVRLGDPVAELAGLPLAATWTPVPGWKRRAAALDLVALHPWPWLRRPGSGSLQSFSAWVRR